MSKQKREKGNLRNRCLTVANKQMVTRGAGGGWVTQVMGIEESTRDVHRVMYGSVKSLFFN